MEVIEVTEREVEIIEVIERGPQGVAGPQPDINYTVVSSARTLEAADLIAADTSGGAFTLTLPANPSNGDAVDIFDFSETFDTNNLTIARNGSKIESLTEDLVCNVEGAYFTLIYTGATRGWQVLPRYGTSGGGGESVLTTQGDTLYRAVGVNARLPIGSAGQVLKVNSGATAPEWGTISTAPSGPAGGDLTGTYPNPTLSASGASAGTYTKVTVDTKGRVTTGATATPTDIGAAAASHTHAASDITSGTVAVARLPIFTYGAGGQGLVPLSIGSQAGQFLKGDGNWTFVTSSDVGLGNVNNTSDANKPISTATQTALNLKANLDSPALTGTPTAPTASAGTNTTQIATTAFTLANRGDRYLTTSTTSHSLTTGSKTFTVQSGLSYTATQDITIVADVDPVNKHMHGVVTSYSGTTLVVDIQTVNQSGGPYTAWTINVGGLLSSEGALYSANNLSDVSSTATALTNLGGVPTSRTLSTGNGLTGGGDLSANRTLSVSFGSSAGTVTEGNDARLSDSRTPTAHAASHAAGTKASYTGIGINESLATSVFIRANNVGTAGNSITLTFDGVDDIDTVLAAWNAANPSNQATLVSGDGTQVPDNNEEIALSGGIAGGSDPFKNINQNLGTDDEVKFAKLLIARTEDNTGQDSAAKLLSTQNTEVGDETWRGRIMSGAENRTFLIGCYYGEAGLGAHSWSSAKNEEGAAWADFLINPDGGADVFIGCQAWDKSNAILKVGNSDGKVTIADQAAPTKKFNFDVSGVTAGQTRSLEIPDANGTIALTSDIPANTIASTLVDAKGDLIVGTAADTVARLPVGATNGHVLTIDSAEASGMKWAAASGGVTSVSGTAPIVSSGGTTPTISVTTGSTAGTVAAGDDSRITGAAQKSANLSDLASASTARTNLGVAIGTDVAAASHTHTASAISDSTTAGRALLTAADAAAQRTSLGLSAIATSGSASDLGSGTVPIALIPTGSTSTTVALGNHSHELTALAATGATNGHVLTANGSNGATFAALPASGVTSVSATAPIVSSGGTTPAISINAATTSAAGSMSAADKTKLDSITGTNTGDQTISLTGDVTGSGTGSFAATIANNAVTNAKLAQVATSTIKGRATAGTGNVEDLTATQVRTILNVADGATANSTDAQLRDRSTHTGTQSASTITGLAASATTDTTNASNISSGTLGTARLASGTANSGTFLRGDQTWAAVSGVTTGSVDNAVLRADGVGGSTSQSSDINIEDATTSTANNVTISNQHSGQTNSSLVLTPKGTGAIIIGPKPDGTSTGGNARGTRAVDLQPTRDSAGRIASGTNSFCIGHSNLASGTRSFAGGTSCTASGESSFAFGDNSSCSSPYGGIASGDGCSSTGAGPSHAFGFSCASTGSYAFSCGFDNTASGSSGSFACGQYSVANRSALFAYASGRFAADGDAQTIRYVLRGTTTTNAEVELLAASDNVRLTIASGRVMFMNVMIVGVANGGGTVATFQRQYAIKNIGGTTSEIYAPVTIGTDSAASTSIALSANDTNDAVKVAATGLAATTIRWVAYVSAVEVAHG